MHDYLTAEPFIYILMVLVLMVFISCIFYFCCLPRWRERRNKIQITPMVEHRIMVNPMRIKTEKVMRMI